MSGTIPSGPKSIREEIMQTRPFKSKGQEATVALLRTTWMVRRRFESLMARHDLTLQQFNVLRILRGAREPLPTMEVADRMIEQEPGITRLTGRLVSKGFVERKRCGEDARRVLCQITDEGLDALRGLDDAVVAMDDLVLGDLSDGELDNFISYLDRIRAHLPEEE